MLTVAFLFLEVWKAFRRPRPALVRKSSFRNKLSDKQLPLHQQEPQQQQQEQYQQQQQEQYQQQQQQQQEQYQQQQQQRQQAESDRSPTTPAAKKPETPATSPSGSDEKRSISGRIPVPAKRVAASESQPQPIQPQVASTTQALHSAPAPGQRQPQEAPQPQQTPQNQQQQQQQQQQLKQEKSPQPSHIPTPVMAKSVKTLVLEPSVSGNRMGEEWAKGQVQQFQFGFEEADKDQSGSLSFDEVYSILDRNGFKGSKQEALVIFGYMDKNQNKQVSKEEFLFTIRSLPKMSLRELALRKTFRAMDKDQNGFLSKQEIADATKDVGVDLAAKKIADLLIYISKEDDDDKVSYDEFLRVLGIESTATVLHKIFAALDTDKSGFLSREEIVAAVKTDCEVKLKAEKISDLLISWVKDDDKKINYNEFVDVWLQQKAKK